MKLRSRFSLLILAILLGFSALAWFFSLGQLSMVNERWAQMLADRQVMFDKHRTLLPLMREIVLARQLAADPAMIEMAQHEDDPAARKRGLGTLETYRKNFRDQSYFAAFTRSGHYYFNDAANQYAGKQLRYTLSREHPADKWFYSTIASDKDYQVNLDPDVHLGVTKVWINVLIRHGKEVLGVIGTGLDITEFLKETVDIQQPGVHNLFVDRDLAIQLYRDAELIDYASLTKDVSQRKKVDLLLKDPGDVERLRVTMKRLESSGNQVETLWVKFKGERYLLGVSWLPEVGWFDLTLMEPRTLFSPEALMQVPLLFGGALAVSLLLIGWVIHRWILVPLARLRASMAEVRSGNYVAGTPGIGKGEIADLSAEFNAMVEMVRKTRDDLEARVAQRTADLQRLSEIDQQTGLYNRRGMQLRFEQELSRQGRHGGKTGLLLLDLDYFKRINDVYGHAAGDVALAFAAQVIRDSIRQYDHAARWGGEEFLVLLPDCEEAALLEVAERIRAGIAGAAIPGWDGVFQCSVSIGAYLASGVAEMDPLLHKADQALYRAKEEGRDRVVLFGPE